MLRTLRFATEARAKPTRTSFVDAFTTLNHYCQINFTVDVHKLARFISPRFVPTTISLPDGQQKAIVSAVVFKEKDFGFKHFPSSLLPKYTFSQTNYRCYCLDQVTGQRTVWFFGTSLDHWSIFVPRQMWRFPWHKAAITFDAVPTLNPWSKTIPERTTQYDQYSMKAVSDWAPAEIHVRDTGRKPADLDFPGFPDKETALIYLTHPMSGHFFLRDTTHLGCWEIWHPPMNPNLAEYDESSNNRNFIGLFENMGLIDAGQKPYNILLQQEINYDIYLPPIESIAKDSRYD